MLTCGASHYYPVVPVTSTRLQYQYSQKLYPVPGPPNTKYSVRKMLLTNYCVVTKVTRLVEKEGVGTTGCCWRHSEVVSSLWCALDTHCAVHGHFGVLWCTPGCVLYLSCSLWRTQCDVPGTALWCTRVTAPP